MNAKLRKLVFATIVQPSGSMNPSVGASVPSFNIRLLVRVQ